MNPHASFGKSLFRRLLRPVLLLVPLAAGLSAASAYQAHYAYDEAGRLLQADYGGGQTIDYAYDANGNLTLRSASSGTEFMLVYTALSGGSILGAATQTVALGGNGTAVTAVTNLYYAFAQWSDGLGAETRTDTNVAANLSVAAQFSAILAAGGTPHWWLAGHGYAGDFDAAEASNDDDDPFTAGQEYVADTDPTNPASFFQILDIDPGPPAVVTFDPASTARRYTFQFTEDLVGGAWSNVPGAFPRLGAGGEDAMQDAGDADRPIYRLQVEVP